MDRTVTLILTFSVLIPALLGLVRLRQISAIYLPFLILMWVGLLNEVVSEVVISLGYHNIYNYNLYQLVESLLILWQFKNLKLFERHEMFRFLGLSLISVFLLDNLFFSGFHYFNSYFSIFYATAVVVMSIHMVNQLLVTERSSLLRHPVFVFCAGFLFFFILNVLTEVFWLYGMGESEAFNQGMQSIFAWTNCFCNIIYAFAILWMPRRLAFSLPY